MALIDEFRKRMQQQQQAVQPAPDVQGQLQKLAQAKTGKAGTPGVPVASTMGQNVANAQLASQAATQGMQQQLQTQQLAAAAQQQQSAVDLFRQRLQAERQLSQQGMAAKQATTMEALSGTEARTKKQLSTQEELKLNALNGDYKNKIADLATNRGIQTDDIFEMFRQDTADLEFRKDSAQLEQMAFQMGMTNKAYLQELDAIGKLRGLENDLNFKKEYAKLKHGAEVDATLAQLGWQSAFDADERTFAMEMGKMDIDAAISLANAYISQANKQAIVSGVIKGGVAASQADWGSTSQPNDYGDLLSENSSVSGQTGYSPFNPNEA